MLRLALIRLRRTRATLSMTGLEDFNQTEPTTWSHKPLLCRAATAGNGSSGLQTIYLSLLPVEDAPVSAKNQTGQLPEREQCRFLEKPIASEPLFSSAAVTVP